MTNYKQIWALWERRKGAACLQVKIFIENFIAFYLHCSTSVNLQNLPHYNK